MAFTTWSALRDSIKDAIADYVSNGGPCTGSYSINGRSLTYRSIDELKRILKLTYEMEEIESTGDPSTRISYGRFRRFG
jgi:hypothetical protein